MSPVSINYLAILVAAIINMIIGALWYSPILFAKPWMAAIGKKMEDMRSGTMGATYGIAALCALVVAYIMAHFVNYAGATTIATGAATGFWAWLGFVVTTHAVTHLFEGKSTKLYFITIGYQLVNFVIVGAILAVWR